MQRKISVRIGGPRIPCASSAGQRISVAELVREKVADLLRIYQTSPAQLDGRQGSFIDGNTDIQSILRR